MLRIEELSRLATDLESLQVERKASFKTVKADIEEVICAFSNDLPSAGRGVLLIGVDDKTGRPVGLQVTDELLREITDIRCAGNILPLPMLQVYKAALPGGEIVVVEVEPSADTPVRLRGRVAVRVGPRKGTASREEERILIERRRAADLPFDARPMRGPTLEDVDLDRFRTEYLVRAIAEETLAENQRPLVHQLESLRLVDPAGLPTPALMLLYGREPRRWLPGAYIQFVRFEGREITDPVRAHREIKGTIPEMLRSAHDLLELSIQVSLDPLASPHVEHPDYPLGALKQLLGNAMMHRSYQIHAPVRVYWFVDRLEIESPGGLFGRVTPESFGLRGATDYRNPTLAEGMKVLGFVQAFGFGIPSARRLCMQNGNPEPSFEFGASHVSVTVRLD